MNEDMRRLEEIIAEVESSELSSEEKSDLFQEATTLLVYCKEQFSRKKDHELLTRLALRIDQYQDRHNCTKEELAEHFIAHIAFNPNNSSFKFQESKGWKVIEQDDFDPENIIIHEFYTESEALQTFDRLYPDGADGKAKKFLIYEGTVDLIPKAGSHAKSQIDLSGKSDSEVIEDIVSKGASNFADQISGILKAIKDEEQTGIMNNTNPKTLREAIHKRKSLQEKLEKNRAKHVFELLRDDPEKGKYLVSEESWKNQLMVTGGENDTYPNPANDIVTISKITSIGYPILLELDRFLSDKMEVSVGMVLATVHASLAESMGANPNRRDALSGYSESDESNIKFGRHMGSNLTEMIEEMAYKGFDIQPIFDRSIGGHCIGMVKLSDVAGLMSDTSFILREALTVGDLRNHGVILPPPPQLDASTDLSIAGNILSHGNDCIIINFNPDPENWSGSSKELVHITKVLEPGYHIMTSHDVIAYRLNN